MRLGDLDLPKGDLWHLYTMGEIVHKHSHEQKPTKRSESCRATPKKKRDKKYDLVCLHPALRLKKRDDKYDLVCLHVLPICSLAILNLLLPTFDIVC